MTRNNLIQSLAEEILNIQKVSPVLVWIDGVDASGKTSLAKELVDYFKRLNHNVISSSIDDFHNPREVRYRRGENSSEWYYYDSFNNKAVADILLNPLSSESLEYKTAFFDYRVDSEVDSPIQKAEKNSILIMEWIFLFRPELIKYWDLKIFVDVDFKFTLERAIKRATDRNYIGSEQEVIDKYNKRYIPWQRLYFKEAKPKENADIVVDNTDFESPVIAG